MRPSCSFEYRSPYHCPDRIAVRFKGTDLNDPALWYNNEMTENESSYSWGGVDGFAYVQSSQSQYDSKAIFHSF